MDGVYDGHVKKLMRKGVSESSLTKSSSLMRTIKSIRGLGSSRASSMREKSGNFKAANLPAVSHAWDGNTG